MIQTFANLNPQISEAISSILNTQETTKWLTQAEKLHLRYMKRQIDQEKSFILDYTDALAYLALRAPATYAQIYGTLSQIQELIPSWQPQSLLDIGSEPGTTVWATQTIWPTLKIAECLDQDKNFLSISKEILQKSQLPIEVTWHQQDLMKGLTLTQEKYDLIIIANLLNEITPSQQIILLQQAHTHCSGILIIIEPGTPLGFEIIQKTAEDFSKNDFLLAPYINNSFVKTKNYRIHFSQRFIRPEFLRRVRQKMRHSYLMASDWEESKYSYLAIGKITPELSPYARSIGPIKKQKGFLEIPILTESEITQLKILKRHKKEYTIAKKLRWGETIPLNPELKT